MHTTSLLSDEAGRGPQHGPPPPLTTEGSFTGTAGNDNLVGTPGADTFDLSQGGKDTVSAGGGDDQIFMGATLTAADKIDGGDGRDTVYLDGDYSAGLTFNATTLTNVEAISFAAGHSYNITTVDATVSAGVIFAVDGSGLQAGDALTFDGAAETDGSFSFFGSAATDKFTGGAGNDEFYFGNGFKAADRIDGGSGADELFLNGDYSAGVTLAAATIKHISLLSFFYGHNYDIIENDGNVAAGATMVVDAHSFEGGETIMFDGSAETNGSFVFNGGLGQDDFTGGAQNDTFNMYQYLTPADRIDGGGGAFNTLVLDGDYSSGLTFQNATIKHIKTIQLVGGHSYDLVEANGNAAAGGVLVVQGSALSAADKLVFDGSAETDAQLVVYGGAGADTLTGGSSGDILEGQGGGDHLTGGPGADAFYYYKVSDSTGPNYDTITGFDFNASDTFELFGVAVSGINAAVTHGALSGAGFNSDLKAAIGAAQLKVGHAVLFEPDSGTLSGKTFLVVDANGVAGYQANSDYVFRLVSSAHIGNLDKADFVEVTR